ncbi:MAG: hypothetical protein ACLU6Y_03450 [Ruminococcus sp.]
MDLSTLVKMSNTYGSNPAYVLAGGGNTSVKDDTTLYCKRLCYTACRNQVRGICGNEAEHV